MRAPAGALLCDISTDTAAEDDSERTSLPRESIDLHVGFVERVRVGGLRESQPFS